MPEWLFVDKRFHLVLLGLHILFLLISFKPWYFILEKYSHLSKQQSSPSSNLQLLLLPLFMSNFIGIVFARSLHYQVSMTKSISRKFWMTIYFFSVLRLVLSSTTLPTLVYQFANSRQIINFGFNWAVLECVPLRKLEFRVTTFLSYHFVSFITSLHIENSASIQKTFRRRQTEVKLTGNMHSRACLW